jgi:cell division septal protein FtsQ
LASWARIGALAVATGVIVAGLWVALDDRFYVQDVSVLGAERVPPEQVRLASRLAGLHMLWLRTDQVEARVLASVPSLESVRVDCTWPASCSITVVESEPQVVWEDEGRIWWFDDEGLIIPGDGSLPNAWVVRGPLQLGETGLLDERIKTGLQELSDAGADMARVYYFIPERGLAFIDERGWRVIVGHGEGMGERLDALERVARHLREQGVTPELVDVRFPAAPYFTLPEG